ncbi:MAG: A/G-specific adenine glycosylase [Proteobacteria bacterium]|nr:A/G-specific adenine glycosylase [Pseudomonadota bacterium]
MGNSKAADTFASQLLGWYEENGRKDLPWQTDPTPYRVWVSEIMLQQTQVGTVIPYFNDFVQGFRNVAMLAEATQDQVLHCWSGLGYYARARNLHAAARLVMKEHDGELPDSMDELMQLPGIGRSTAGAILALSSGQRCPILDGNVKRVLARYHEIDGWPGKSAVLSKLWALAERHLPDRDISLYTQAIMDLGATVCRRRPDCAVCPVATGCQARASGRQLACPGKKPVGKKRQCDVIMLIACLPDGSVYLERRPPRGIWGGLWSFPEIELESEAANWCQARLSCRVERSQALEQIKHSLTHFEMNIRPILLDVVPTGVAETVMDERQKVWYNGDGSQPIGMAAPVAKLMEKYANCGERH